MNLFIASASSKDIDEKYFIECERYLDKLFEEKNNLVFGACPNGLMGLSYRMAKKYSRKVIGIAPPAYDVDFDYLDCDIETRANSVGKRNSGLINNSEAIICLPGGVGTAYEFFAAVESKKAHEFDKPIIVYNCFGYYDKMLEFLEHIYEEKFTAEEIKNLYHVSNSVDDTILYLSNYYKK